MSKRPASAAPAETTRLYEAAVKATAGAELKGATMPYTSVNGNMYSFLDKAGVVAIRLGETDRHAFMRVGGVICVHETGAVMREYVIAPPALIAKTKALSGWLSKGLAYARTLKPKPTAKKKAA
jgi:hypothetical protein